MTGDSFYGRLGNYYQQVAAVIRGEADAASVFPNPSDVGSSRETIYADFLRQHVPSKCNVLLGGFLFHEDGSESKQVDIIVTTDTAPQFNFHNSKGEGKSFAPVEGTLAVASIKSRVGKSEIHNALSNIASIPPSSPLKPNPMVRFGNVEFPFKIVFALGANASAEAVCGNVLDYYRMHPHIPLERRPHVIHVANTCAIFRVVEGYKVTNAFTGEKRQSEVGKFELFSHNHDLPAILFILHEIERRASFSNHILYNYGYIVDKVQEAAFKQRERIDQSASKT